MNNLILATDSYKATHWLQYPPETEHIYSYFESRGGLYGYTVFFGLQDILHNYFGFTVDEADIEEAKELLLPHIGYFNEEGWRHIVKDHGGYLPLRIKAVPEGTLVPTLNVLMTVENTCPKCFWLTNYMETLLVQTWYPTTVCTLSHSIKQLIKGWLKATADNTDGLEFKLHDFGFRGVSSVESAGRGGCAHLVNFKGTDTLAALQVARNVYQAVDMPGFSVPAAEHSTITSWSSQRTWHDKAVDPVVITGEERAYWNMLDRYPAGIVAVVSDSYDIYHACEHLWGGSLRNKVLQRSGTVVIRPDSGHPPEVVCKVLSILGEKFGYTTNSKGYKVLPPQVRVIQGDGINERMIGQILHDMAKGFWSAANITFGMGGALLQQVNRDTQKFAFKCSAIKTKYGDWRPVQKKPITDPWKNSKAGRLKLIKDYTGFKTVGLDEPGEDLLRVVYENGRVATDNLDNIRRRANEV